jgi:N-acetylmuramate 1-kinase
MTPDPRRDALAQFARQMLHAPCRIEPAATDASFRRYFRLRGAFGSVIGMDAPPPQEDVRPFVHVAGLLAGAGVNAPQIIAADPQAGFLLLTDFGTEGYLGALRAAPQHADGLMDDALAALVRWQAATRADQLPPYDAALLGRELALFPDWYVAHELGVAFTAQERAQWDALAGQLVARALAQPRVYVHRDYMVRNLMVASPNPGVLDFQDAVLGPVTYDLASLLRDAFLSFAPEEIERWTARYWQAARTAGVPVPDSLQALQSDLDWMGTQRHLKVLGIFARLKHRDGKAAYLEDAPRFLRYIREAAGREAGLAPLAQLLGALHARAGRT